MYVHHTLYIQHNWIVDKMRIHIYEKEYLYCNLVAQSNAVQSSTDVHGESQTRNKLSEVVLTELLGFQDLCPTPTHVRQLFHQHTGTETSLQNYQEQERIRTGGLKLHKI